MFQRFLSVRKAYATEDKETPPLLPISTSSSPGCGDQTLPVKLEPPILNIPPPPRRSPQPTPSPTIESPLLPASADVTHPIPREEALVPITVDSRMPTTFYIPRQYIPNALHRTRKQHKRNYSAADASTLKDLYLPKLQTHHFYDFVAWLNSGKILRYHHGGSQLRIEANVARLVEAVAVGVYVECREYVAQAMAELLEVAEVLDRPEDFIDVVMAATSPPHAGDSWRTFHPVVRLWIAVVAAKTKGPDPRILPKGRSSVFWKVFEEYIQTSDCTYPEDLEAFFSS